MPVRGRGIDLDTMSVAEAQVTSSVSISATTSATGSVVLTLGPFTLDGPKTLYLEAFTPVLVKGTTNVSLEWWLDGAPGTGTLLTVANTLLTGNVAPYYNVVRVGPLATGNHTLRLAGFVDAGTGTFTAGAGTPTATNPNAWGRAWIA